ncbi:rhomboid-like protein [Streptomyces silaceus]|uniref:rhomboid-like protein n=1 Tax=Streptomyces silaceus TaxID=545123 RepID=UPI000ABF6368|nr:rhomboid-like protein [Streptomyces silaceus]
MNQSVRPAEVAPDAETPGTLNAIPRQSPPGESRDPDARTRAGLSERGAPARAPGLAPWSAGRTRTDERTPSDAGRTPPGTGCSPSGTGHAPSRAACGSGAVEGLRARARAAGFRPWRLLPTPIGTPFTFGYALVLAATSLLAAYADPDLVSALLHGSSTDVAHLAHSPVLVLVASALWIAGGITSPYAIGFLLVLTALERRIGGLRTAGVFLLGHVVATLATEVPVGLSVLAGHLPDTSLHRLDYGISFGVAASVGALAGLLTPWLRWIVLAGFGWMLVDDLIAFTDPMTNWGHLMALLIGVATWPLLRRRRRPRTPSA